MDIFKILSFLKHRFILFLTQFKIFFIHHFSKSKKAICIVCTPRHSNLGDHAIVYAQKKLFADSGCEKNIVEISCTTYEFFKEKISKKLRNSDLIIIDGGGNIGTLWIGAENDMRDIIRRFPENPIFIMPQTAFFEDTPYGIEELSKSVEIYSSHPDLTIFCRDSDTYDLISKKFTTVKSFYTPDTVMFITDLNYNNERKGALICLREDLEKTCSDETKQAIENYLNSRQITHNSTSTLVNHQVEMWQRNEILNKKWNEFASAEFVVTDRLHGMIFAAITSTPCLAMDNISHKVLNGYKWLENLPYIEFCSYEENPVLKLEKIIDISKEKHTYKNRDIQENYELIKKIIKDEYQKR